MRLDIDLEMVISKVDFYHRGRTFHTALTDYSLARPPLFDFPYLNCVWLLNRMKFQKQQDLTTALDT